MRESNSKLNVAGMKGPSKQKPSRPSKKERVRMRKSMLSQKQKLVTKPTPKCRVKLNEIARYRLTGPHNYSGWTVDFNGVFESADHNDTIECSHGDTVGTNWHDTALTYGESMIQCGVQRSNLWDWVMLWKKQRYATHSELVTNCTVSVVKKSVRKVLHAEDTRSMLQWARKKGPWVDKNIDLEQAYTWYNHVKSVKGSQREFVKKRLQWAIKKFGGEVIPKQVLFRIPAGVKVERRSIRRWWLTMIQLTKGHLPKRAVHEWREALVIMHSKRRCIGDIIVNGSKKSRDAVVVGEVGSKCSCHGHPDLVQEMKDQFPEVWQETGHMHMPTVAVPWPEAVVCQVSSKSMVVGGYRKAENEFWDSIRLLSRRVVTGKETRASVMKMAKASIQCSRFDKVNDEQFREDTVSKLKAKSNGLTWTELDRNAGKLWLTRDELYDQFGRNHFKFAEDKR